MSDRDWGAEPGMYLEIPAILDGLIGDIALRNITQAARENLKVALATLSFRAPEFSTTTSLFVRDSLVTPMDFALCAVTAANGDIVTVPRLVMARHQTRESVQLRSYAGCAVRGRQSDCVGVFHLMDTKPRRWTPLETARLRAYAHLVSSRIEIIRRFGTDGGGPSPGQLVRLADQLARVGQDSEAQDLIALAYAAHDIAGIRYRTPDHMPS